MLLVGSLTALATPFGASGELDLDAFGRLIEQQLTGGTQGLIVAGSTGEAAALSVEEYDSLLRFAVAQVGGRVPVLAGSGQSATAATIAQTRRAAEAGVDAALVVTPPYVRPTQRGLVAHYQAVAERGGLPVVLYNVPGRTGVDLLPETVAELCDVPGIVGIKEAKAGAERMQALLALKRPGFALLSGDDGTAADSFRAGFDGVISVASNVAPRLMRALWDARGDVAHPRLAAHAGLFAELFDFLGVESNPIPVKALLAARGWINDALRLPLLSLSAPLRPAAIDLAERIDAVERLLAQSAA